MHKIIISTLLLTSLSFADKSYSFMGAQTSFLNYDGLSSPSFGLKYGVQKGMWRSSINLDYSKNGDNSLGSLILQVDKGIFKNDSPLKPHVGFSFGLVEHHKIKSETGYGVGLNTGVTYLLNDAIDLDLSYRYLSTSKIDNLSSVNTLTLSLHYFY